MKRILILILLSIFFQLGSASVMAQGKSSASLLDPKTKAFLVICGYGTVGGGLLGLASMAFGQDSKAIAQGASLGLYAGILFGAYVIYTHNQELSRPDENYQDSAPYEEPFVPFQDTTTNLSIPHWQGSSLEKLQAEYNPRKTIPSISWSWSF